MANPMLWHPKHPNASIDMLGFLPDFLNNADPRSARDQLASAYVHGGGWSPFQGFTMLRDGNLQYTGDPVVLLLWETKLRDETVRFYECAWVAIVQPDGQFEVARMD